MKTSSLKCKDQTLVGFVYASILIKYVFKVLSILIIFVYCCKYDIYDFTFSRWRILLAEPPYSKNISCYFNRGIDSVKITALSNHKPGILNNYIRIIFFFQKIGERVTEDQLHDILNEVDVNKNAQVDIGEFLQVSTLYARHSF